MSIAKTYTELVKVYKRIANITHASSFVGWDCHVNMPHTEAASKARSNAMQELEVLAKDQRQLPHVQDLVAFAKSHPERDGLSEDECHALRELLRDFNLNTQLDEDLIRRRAAASTEAHEAWLKARPANDWESFAPKLEKLLELVREEGVVRQKAGGHPCPYSALLDIYEPGMTVAKLDEIFKELEEWIPAKIREARARQTKSIVLELEGSLTEDEQKELGHTVMRGLGLDMSFVRLDKSPHPFCGGVPDDVRITTRYKEGDFIKALFGIIHESGHARYQQNLPPEWRNQPCGEARSMGIHESQSLLAEVILGCTSSFLQWLEPILKEHLPHVTNAKELFDPENMRKLLGCVGDTKIRVESDPLSYPMHIALRYRIEKGLVNGTLSVSEIPSLWRREMKRLLDLDLEEGEYTDGCMQDVHWPIGLFGYFPTYMLGAAYAAQFDAALRRDIGSDAVDKALSTGNPEPIINWLREKVWKHGSLKLTDDLVRDATGSALDLKHYKAHLHKLSQIE